MYFYRTIFPDVESNNKKYWLQFFSNELECIVFQKFNSSLHNFLHNRKFPNKFFFKFFSWDTQSLLIHMDTMGECPWRPNKIGVPKTTNYQYGGNNFRTPFLIRQ